MDKNEAIESLREPLTTPKIDRETKKELKAHYGSVESGAIRAIKLWSPLRNSILTEIKGLFAQAELKSMIAAFKNNLGRTMEFSHNVIMISNFLAEFYKSQGLAGRYNVQIYVVTSKIEKLKPYQSIMLIEWVVIYCINYGTKGWIQADWMNKLR